MQRNKKEFSQKFLYKMLVYLVSVLVVAAIGGVLGVVQYKNKQEEAARIAAEEEAKKEKAKAALTEEEIEKLFKDHKIADVKDAAGIEEETNTETASEAKTEESAEGGNELVDWEGLWKINADVYAWISIPGTKIDYPILQHPSDNSYYLNYNIDGSYGYPGCIYTENLNAKDFTDPNTVIYGHNMKNGSMFAGLHQYEDKVFFEKNDTVIIYTPDETFTYTIFAAYIYDDRHLLYSFDFANEEVYAAYLDEVKNKRDLNANIRKDIELTKEDRIITLVTCMSKQPEKRLLVQAVLNQE